MAADGEDYPRTLAELERRFSSEEACRAYLGQLRWPDGFRCPACGADHGWPTGRGDLIECSRCHHQTSVIAGTIFEGTRKPLPMWFRAMWLVTSEKNGVSALGLQRQLGIGSYETAWAWLHKLRRVWSGSAGTDCTAWWRWTRPSWAAWSPGCGAGRRPRSPW